MKHDSLLGRSIARSIAHAQRSRIERGERRDVSFTGGRKEDEIREETAGLYYPTLTSDGDFGFSVVKLTMPMDG